MLKVVLYAYVSLLALACYSQQPIPEWSGPAVLVVEDPSKNVANLNAVASETGKLFLTWMVNDTVPEFFSIERSADGKAYEVVGVLNKLGTQKQYQWTDEAPQKGKNFYRLRYSYRPGQSLYSKTVSAVPAGNVNYKFYPNPVDHILIVRSDSPIDVQISDANGRIRITQNRVQGIYTINVSSLEKGIYLIRFSNKLTNVMSQEKLVKN